MSPLKMMRSSIATSAGASGAIFGNFSFPPVIAESLKVSDGSGFQGSLGKTGSPGSKKIDGPFSEERCFADIAYFILPSLIWRRFCQNKPHNMSGS